MEENINKILEIVNAMEKEVLPKSTGPFPEANLNRSHWHKLQRIKGELKDMLEEIKIGAV